MSVIDAKHQTTAAVSPVQLGTAANLLYGVKPVWSGTADGMFAPPVAPTETSQTTIEPAEDDGWDLPVVTLHTDAASLLDELYDYRVARAALDDGEFSVPAGVLAVGDSDRPSALNQASEFLGVDLTKGDSYMLVRLRRCVGKARSTYLTNFGDRKREDYLTKAAREAYAKLPTGTAVTKGDLQLDMKLTADEASTYVKTFYELGTHFVSSVETGDVIFQVFACPPGRFAQLKAAFDKDKDQHGRVTGLAAIHYAYFTTPCEAPHNGDTPQYGFVSQTGKLVAFSGDKKLDDTVAAGKWKDARYANDTSIFRAYSDAQLLDAFTAVTTISIGLTPLADLVPDAFHAKVLNRLFNGALMQKYGAGVTVPFTRLRDYSWKTLFPDAGGAWLSTIATPTIDVYQDLVDLGTVQMVNTEAVESFTATSFAMLVSGKAPVDLPGSTVTLTAYILDTSTTPQVPTLRVGPKAFDALKVSVGEMYGALTLASTDGSKRDVLLDGFRFRTGAVDRATGRATVELRGDVISPPAPATLARITRDLQFSIVSAEALMWSRGAHQNEIHDLTRGYLDWLAGLVPADSQDADLVALAAQARYLAKAARSLSGYGTPVPYLTFNTYAPYVDSLVKLADALSDKVRDYQQQIAGAKQAELSAKTAATINDNVKATGKLLTDYFGVLAQNQQNTAGYYGAIADQKRQELGKAATDIATLESGLKEQQGIVDQAVQDFQKAVANWQTEQILKFCLTVATDVFSLGVAFAIPATEISAVKSLGETAQKIQKVFNVLNALSKLGADVETNIRTLRGAETALRDLDHSLEMPTTLEWQEFVKNMTASLAGVPGDIALEKAKLTTAFDILSLRGQALVNAKGKRAQLLTDIYFNERQKAINEQAASRLDELRGALHPTDTSAPELSKIDLIGLTGEVQAQLKQVLAALAKTLALQDAAVQYDYLGAPTPIERFDLTSLKQVMARQQQSIVNALNQLNPPPRPVDKAIAFRVQGVPTSALTGGKIYDFTIQPSAPEFWKYAMVRVDKVLLRVEGIAGSTRGEYLAKLSFVGEPFEDRDASRKPIEFNTVQRKFGPYDYDIATGKPRFGDKTGAIGKKISKITPFGTWQVSLPPSDTNEGIRFAGETVDIVLSFTITALLVDEQPRPKLRAAAPRIAAAVTPGPGDQSRASMLDNMYTSQAVLRGWDVVFNVLEEPINKFLKQQYDEKYQGRDMTVKFGFCEGPVKYRKEFIATYTKIEVTLGGPLLEFQQNNHDSVTVTQPIRSGSIQVGSRSVSADWKASTNCNLDDPTIEWDDKTQVDVSNSPHIQGTVALAKVQGVVEPAKPGGTTHSVVLDFANGSFVTKEFKVEGANNALLNDQLTNWFTNNAIRYIVNTVDFSDLTTLPALQPTKFLLNVLTTNSGKNILQQFITTNGVQRSNLTVAVGEPIPDGYDCTLMVNTKVMFNDIFVKSFNHGSTNILVEAIDPGADFKAWSAKITSGSVVGTAKFPTGGDREYRINASGNTVVWDVGGLKFERTPQMAVQLSYTVSKNQPFESRSWMCTSSSGGVSICGWTEWGPHSVDVNVVLSGQYPIVIQGSDKDQTIQLKATKPDVDVSNTSIHPKGPTECNDNDLKLAVLAELKKDVPAALQDQLGGIAFQPLSTFALENLLFPGGTLITMTEAYVPGDLVVLGRFKTA